MSIILTVKTRLQTFKVAQEGPTRFIVKREWNDGSFARGGNPICRTRDEALSLVGTWCQI